MKHYKIGPLERAALDRLLCEPDQRSWTSFNAVHDSIYHARASKRNFRLFHTLKPDSHYVLGRLIKRGLIKRQTFNVLGMMYQLTDKGRELIIAAKIAQELTQ